MAAFGHVGHQGQEVAATIDAVGEDADVLVDPDRGAVRAQVAVLDLDERNLPGLQADERGEVLGPVLGMDQVGELDERNSSSLRPTRRRYAGLHCSRRPSQSVMEIPGGRVLEDLAEPGLGRRGRPRAGSGFHHSPTLPEHGPDATAGPASAP